MVLEYSKMTYQRSGGLDTHLDGIGDLDGVVVLSPEFVRMSTTLPKWAL